VAEFDTPAELIKRGGRFYELAKEAGLIDSDGLASSQI
jgi:ATP-binding cassette subfamily C (CFTR/MRP) protein 1